MTRQRDNGEPNRFYSLPLSHQEPQKLTGVRQVNHLVASAEYTTLNSTRGRRGYHVQEVLNERARAQKENRTSGRRHFALPRTQMAESAGASIPAGPPSIQQRAQVLASFKPYEATVKKEATEKSGPALEKHPLYVQPARGSLQGKRAPPDVCLKVGSW